jgi:hypothetical protein
VLGVRVFATQLRHTASVRAQRSLIELVRAQGYQPVAVRPVLKVTFLREDQSATAIGTLSTGGPKRIAPREHWTKLRSTNPLERVNKEIGRRRARSQAAVMSGRSRTSWGQPSRVSVASVSRSPESGGRRMGLGPWVG